MAAYTAQTNGAMTVSQQYNQVPSTEPGAQPGAQQTYYQQPGAQMQYYPQPGQQ